MNFLAPGAFFLGLLLPIIVALYLLKLRRTEHEVPSIYLWRKMVRDVEANAPWQRLRPNLLMILQLLFLIVLILALARPFSWSEGASGQATILILDTSASMAATDVSPSRLESARTRARQLIDDLPDTARVTVIEAGSEARVLLASSLDRREAHLALQTIQAGIGGSDMATALELASAIAARQPGAEIIVLSDGRVTLPKALAVKASLRFIPFGLSDENQAVSLLTLEAAPGGAGLTAFAQVSNYAAQPASRRLNLFADGQLINSFDLNDIPAGGQKSAIAEGLPPGVRVVTAWLAGQDALALDDSAAAVRPDTQPVPVTLVTQGNLFIQTALSLLPGVALTEQDLGSPPIDSPTPSASPSSSPVPMTTALSSGVPVLTVYDNTVPDVLPASGSLLFIAPPRSSDYFTTTGIVTEPTPRTIDTSDPLTVHLAFDQVNILDAVRIPLPDWATPVVSGELKDGNTPLIFRGEVAGRRIAVIAFDLRHSDLPLQVAFPLLWSNLVDWLAPGARSPLPTQAAPGESLAFDAPDGSTSATVTCPEGPVILLTAESGRFLFTGTHQLGVYRVSFPPAGSSVGREASFAVNLFSPQESSLKPADALPNLAAQPGQVTGGQRAQREWWRPLAFLALGLLVGEWLVYQRAALAHLRDFLLRKIRNAPPQRGAHPGNL